jgi:hypothetical protein
MILLASIRKIAMMVLMSAKASWVRILEMDIAIAFIV